MGNTSILFLSVFLTICIKRVEGGEVSFVKISLFFFAPLNKEGLPN